MAGDLLLAGGGMGSIKQKFKSDSLMISSINAN